MLFLFNVTNCDRLKLPNFHIVLTKPAQQALWRSLDTWAGAEEEPRHMSGRWAWACCTGVESRQCMLHMSRSTVVIVLMSNCRTRQLISKVCIILHANITINVSNFSTQRIASWRPKKCIVIYIYSHEFA